MTEKTEQLIKKQEKVNKGNVNSVDETQHQASLQQKRPTNNLPQSPKQKTLNKRGTSKVKSWTNHARLSTKSKSNSQEYKTKNSQSLQMENSPEAKLKKAPPYNIGINGSKYNKQISGEEISKL